MADLDPVEGKPVRLAPDDVAFLTTDPSMAARRMRFDVDDLVGIIQAALAQRGLPLSVTSQGHWLWTRTDGGAPELYLLLQGTKS